MDANQTRFQLVFGHDDWLGADATTAPTGIEWRASDSTVGLTQNIFVYPTTPGAPQLTAADRRGAAQDKYGNTYWVGPSQDEILFLGGSQQQVEHFWSAKDTGHLAGTSSAISSGGFVPVVPEPVTSFTFGGLAVTTDHYLVVGTLEPAGFLLFDLYAGGPPQQYRWPADVPFAPFALCAGIDGGAWILDRINRRYWGLDAYFRILQPLGASGAPANSPGDFQPVSGSTMSRPQCEPAEQVSINQAMPIAASDPIGIVALPDGSVLVLDSPVALGYSQIYRYQLLTQIGAPVPLNAVDIGQSTPYALLGQDIAFTAAAQQTAGDVRGTLYIADSHGAQTFAFNYDSANAAWALEPDTQFLPMLRFGGKALVASPTGISYDFDQRWALLVPQPRARFELQASWVLPQLDAGMKTDPTLRAFDGREPGCVWHRLLMDGTIPNGTQVIVQSRAADIRELLPTMDWNPEPQPYLRFNGPELPYYRPALGKCSNRTGTWELLFQQAVGRYLQVQITLVGNGRSTPRLQALRAYYPRFSYLTRYLPAVYQDNATSASFLDRYLANAEGTFTALEGNILQVQELFDARTVPPEYLEWLASWLGVSFDFTWSTATRRFFLANAPRFFRTRGTSAGLIRMIRMALDQCADASLFDSADTQHFSVRIVENYLLRDAPGVTFGDPNDPRVPIAIASGAQWTPAQGTPPLDQSYRTYLSTVYADIGSLNLAWSTTFNSFTDSSLRLPAIRPSQATQATDWQQFISTDLSFTYAATTSADEPAFADFLTNRYALIGKLNQAYQLTGASTLSSFADIQAKLWNATLVYGLPASGAFLEDWILFVSTVLPTSRNAYRFTVVVPVDIDADLNTQTQRRNLAQRIAQTEKPAHTSFDVKLYWAVFAVGEGRVGLETVVGPSSRFAAATLGQTELAGGYLGFVEPWNVTGRIVAGRDQLQYSGEPAL